MFLMSGSAHAGAPIKVAVVDTGYDDSVEWDKDTLTAQNLAVPKICPNGRYDFTSSTKEPPKPSSEDIHGHGTHVAGLIASYAANANYCLVILKYYIETPKNKKYQKAIDRINTVNSINTLRAFRKAIALKVDIINYSGGGETYNEAECKVLKQALDSGIIVVAAAGNERSNVNIKKFWPAMCDKRIVAVMNVEKDGSRAASSNYSEEIELEENSPLPNEITDPWHLESEVGQDVVSLGQKGSIAIMSGTSMSTAIMTGRLLRRLELVKHDKYLGILKELGK